MAGARHRRQHFQTQVRGAAALLLLAGLLSGCKSGSWAAKPSWWGGGGSSSLASAPAFDGDVKKPSEAAKPYPTTNTPEGYALSDATKTDPSAPAETQAAAVAPTAVTYGASPPPAAAPAAPAAAPAAVAQTSVGPQVGPYASLQPQSPTPPPPAAIDPAGAATAGMAAAPAFGDAAPPMAQVPSARPPAARYADASGGQAWPPAAAPAATAATAAPVAAGAPAAAPGDDGRYGVSTGSRFGGGPADFAPPPAGPAPTAPPEAPAVPPPAAPPIAPAAPTTAPAALVPAATPPAAVPPPAAPGGAILPGAITPPTRRADPGYRPGGTSSYRPSKTILAGEEPAAPGVLPASFEAPATLQ